MSKKYELVEHEGQTVRRYPDGSLRNEKGHYVKRPPQAAEMITSENAPSLRQRQVEKAQEAIRSALMSHPEAVTDADGLRMIAEGQIELATNPEAGSAATGAAKFIWEKGGYDAPKDRERTRAPALRLEISDIGLDALIAKVGRNVVDGEFKVIEEDDEDTSLQDMGE